MLTLRWYYAFAKVVFVRHTIAISCIIDRLWMTDVIMAKFRDLQ